MTIAAVDEPEARLHRAEVVTSLAGLAVTDELVVVYGSDRRESNHGVQDLVADLRGLLPRHFVVVLYVAWQEGPIGRDAALLDELLELGSLPIVVTPAEAVPDVVAVLEDHLRADRVLRVSGSGSTYARAA